MNRFLLGIVCAFALAVLSQADKSVTASNTPDEVTIPFELVNKHVVLKAKINNSRPLPFLLDTGDKY